MNREGWVPIRLKLLAGDAFVDWCWLGNARFTDPFFDSTIAKAQEKPFNVLFTHRTPIAELGAWHAAKPGLMPAGLIFHMSRCGSTLVSQMLAALPENVVISEAAPLDQLARAAWLPENTRAEWLLWMMSALSQKRSGIETRCFIKFDSTTVLALPFIRRVFPSVPWIFLYRNPEEVLVSHLRDPAAAMSPGMITDIDVIGAPVEETSLMSPEEYAARVTGRLCECAREALDSRGMLVNYSQLPEAVSGGISRHFGMGLSDDEISVMTGVARYHAKRPSREFVPDKDGKAREVSDKVREAAARWVWPRYEQLERLRKRI